MTYISVSLHFLSFSFSLWLGLYLINKRPGDKRLLFTGLGLLSYTISIGVSAFATLTHINFLETLRDSLLFFPALFWTGTLINLFPYSSSFKQHFSRIWLYSLLPLNGLLLCFSLLGIFSNDNLRPSLFALIALAPMLLAYASILLQIRKTKPSQPLVFILLSTLFFALAAGALLLPAKLLPQSLLVFGLGFDILLLGFGIAYFDAFDFGESLLPDMLRSFISFSLLSGLFVGQLLPFIFKEEQRLSLISLGFSSLILCALLTNFASPLQRMLDRLVFAQQPKRQKELASIRAASSALIRSQSETDFNTMSQEHFQHLTRKALSHFSDLNRLGSSPLTQLPLIRQRLEHKGLHDDTLNRTQELKQLLLEAVLSLKPQSDQNFSSSDEWRLFNVLYFPCILGVKPFSQRGNSHLSSTAKEALEYFRTYVPERTFYNWQKAAAELVARHIWETTQGLLAHPLETDHLRN